MAEGKPEGWVDFPKAKAVPFDAVLEGLGLLAGLRREGDKWKGLCPFHKGEKESFAVGPDGWFKCFGCKKQGGNVLEFVRLYKQVSSKEAAQWLVDLSERLERGARAARTPAPAVGAADVLDELTVREQAICRGVARYLAAVFAPLGNVEVIEQELTALVREETERMYT